VLVAVGGDVLHGRGVDDYVQAFLGFDRGIVFRVESY
jgi:hypothetical protein